jgi:AraC-like DNA-binding protein
MHPSQNKLHISPFLSWQILDGGSYEALKGRDFPLHSHTCWEWVYYRTGSIDCLHGGEVLSMHPGTLWITPPGVAHAEIAKTAYSNMHFGLEGPPDVKMPKVVQDDAEGTIGQLLRVILQELRGRHPTNRKAVDLLTGALSLRIAHSLENPNPTATQQLVNQAEMCWEDHPLLSVEEMAKRFGVSVSGFRQAFHEERGHSPVESRMQLRTGRAVRLLRSSTLKLDAVAEMCGFHSASHLSRCIKAAEGCSPGALRTTK